MNSRITSRTVWRRVRDIYCDMIAFERADSEDDMTSVRSLIYAGLFSIQFQLLACFCEVRFVNGKAASCSRSTAVVT